jgi:hypothetical protein
MYRNPQLGTKHSLNISCKRRDCSLGFISKMNWPIKLNINNLSMSNSLFIKIILANYYYSMKKASLTFILFTTPAASKHLSNTTIPDANLLNKH